MTGRPTIYDVAETAGVSPSTVSRALARPGEVSAVTAERVRSAAETLDYRTSSIGAPRSSSSTGIVLLVTSDVTNPFVFELIHGAEDVAFASGLAVAVADSRESGPRERTLVERAMSRIDAVVLVSSRLPDSAIRMIAKQRPTVVLNRAVRDVASVSTDYRGAAAEAVRYLRELGHDSVDYLAGPAASWADGARWRTLLGAARDGGLRLRRTGPVLPTVEGGIGFAEKLRGSPPTAVIAFNDQIAVGLAHGMAAAGVGVPSDLSVLGFDDTTLARLVVPRLTTIATPLRRMGGSAISTTVDLLAGRTSSVRGSTEMPADLIVRESTGPRRTHVTPEPSRPD